MIAGGTVTLRDRVDPNAFVVRRKVDEPTREAPEVGRSGAASPMMLGFNGDGSLRQRYGYDEPMLVALNQNTM